MRKRRNRVATAAATPLNSTQVVYHNASYSATTINDVLAVLLFGMASPHLSVAARTTLLGRIDRLVRLKIDLGFLKGRRR